jgi:RNA polymerase sigma-70 factor (ECF subfamily)
LEAPLRIPDQSDGELAAAAAQGDGDAFGRLVERHALQAHRVARAILRNSEDAEDAVQDGVLAAWRALGRYDPARPFRPWLMRIVVNAALDARRRWLVRRGEPLSEGLVAGGISPEKATDQSLFRERLREALLGLPERQRLAVVLFDAEGYPHAEIAEVLGVPEGTVRSYVFHARRALREALGDFKEDAR